MKFRIEEILFVVLIVLAALSTIVQAQPADIGKDAAVDADTVYGWQLMTEAERIEFRDTLRTLKTQAEKQQFRIMHRENMKARADAKGLTLAPPRRAAHHGNGEGRDRQEGKRRNPPAFAEFDTNSDRFIDQAEFMAGHAVRFKQRAEQGRKMKRAGDLTARFSDIDTDQDGRVSRSEFATHQESHRAKHRSNRHSKRQS